MEKVKVMIVDDSRISCAALTDLLKKTKFEVVATARSATEAIDYYLEYRPQIVTMDMNLPDMNGIECSRQIRTHDENARILMVSSMLDDTLVARGKKAGIENFLQKPVSAEDFIGALTKMAKKSGVGQVSFRDVYVKAFTKSLQDTISSFTGEESLIKLVDPVEPVVINGVAVILGLTGEPTGRIIMHMDQRTMNLFVAAFLNRDSKTIDSETALETLQEAANIAAGRGVSMINNVVQDCELRLTPPGIIIGSKVSIAGSRFKNFSAKCVSVFGTIILEMGFSEGD